ncbi:MAG TPA: glycosyltransferase [Bacteroidales bacterium]|nr:glycosyltransferase [Bacteroidales bacterium]
MENRKNILICPLEWGLGHAARMIPLASELLKLNHNVIFASGEGHLSFIRKELPECSCISFPGFNPRYSRFLPVYLSMLIRLPQLIFHIISEHHRLNKIIPDHSIDIVISDNRFGLWNKKIESVYVTHMLRIPFPKAFRFLEPIGVFLHRQIIRKYDFCYIPDLPGIKNISGRLSHGLKLPGNVRYTGFLSRFKYSAIPAELSNGSAYNTAILSGPEPQKEMLKKKLISIFRDKKPLTFILEGKPHLKEEPLPDGNIIIYNHMPLSEMHGIISGSDGIICRSGYTTIMDLIILNTSALLVPTPGQTEQEYLAKYLSDQGMFSYISQRRISEKTEFPHKIKYDYSGLVKESSFLLGLALKELLNKKHNETH